jgi:hypothetical protein
VSGMTGVIDYFGAWPAFVTVDTDSASSSAPVATAAGVTGAPTLCTIDGLTTIVPADEVLLLRSIAFDTRLLDPATAMAIIAGYRDLATISAGGADVVVSEVSTSDEESIVAPTTV